MSRWRKSCYRRRHSRWKAERQMARHNAGLLMQFATGIEFGAVAPPAVVAHNRSDIACFIGFVHRRKSTELPAHTLAAFTAAGWAQGGAWARSEEDLESALHLPVAVDSWDAFHRLYAWEQRPLAPSSQLRCASYMGAAPSSSASEIRGPTSTCVAVAQRHGARAYVSSCPICRRLPMDIPSSIPCTRRAGGAFSTCTACRT
jgi:hypothetical protein